jgi:NAD(P)-dependent dehydrogenase (short-subunit alcohol dehydrogenase family)
LHTPRFSSPKARNRHRRAPRRKAGVGQKPAPPESFAKPITSKRDEGPDALSVEKFGKIDCLFNNAGGPAQTGGIEGLESIVSMRRWQRWSAA